MTSRTDSQTFAIRKMLRGSKKFAQNNGMPPVEATSSFAISGDIAELLWALTVQLNVSSVLEFGAGASSLVFADALTKQVNGRLTSIETDPAWCQKLWDANGITNSVDATMLHANLRLSLGQFGAFYAYDSRGPIAARQPFDLVFIDAPQWYFGREGCLHSCFDLLRVGAVIIVDDADRSGERAAIARWLRQFSGLRLVAFTPQYGKGGVAVLQVTKPLQRRTRPAFLVPQLIAAARMYRCRRKILES
jgi:predicted O-methyltransferase YrrM